MNSFITRVELHDAKDIKDYDVLHAAMEAKGFHRYVFVRGSSPIKSHLPTAEYEISGIFTGLEVLELAKSAAMTTRKDFCVYVTQSNGAWAYNLKPM